MSQGAEVAIKAAAANLAGMRVSAALVVARLRFAGQQMTFPAGGIDLMDDLVSLQLSIERLQKQVDALADGKPIPA